MDLKVKLTWNIISKSSSFENITKIKDIKGNKNELKLYAFKIIKVKYM